ncbi:MAG TPA: Bcr/CflA family efflux MFS transporter, partial [Arthrobacter sp.]|nr:Bcr/CflA family efflux MFS transporter [Arthrobacter sp.]
MTTPTNPGDSLSRRRKLLYILMLGALTALGPFTVDLYLPAFPALEESLAVSEAAMQLTLTGTTLGFALGQLVVGPLSDKFGRRMPLILATAVHIVASLGAALSTDITTLGFFRVLMGIGAAGGGVVAMAMVRDLFSGFAMVRMFSRMALVNGLAPILAPVIGSQLLLFMPWPGIFFFLAGYGMCVLIAAIFVVRETLPRELRGKTGMTARQRYGVLFRDRIFVGLLLVGGMNFAGLFTYLSASPFLFQDIYGFTPQQYGLLFGINS